VWDRAQSVEPDTFLYFTTPKNICRLNVKTSRLEVVFTGTGKDIIPYGIVCLPGSGIIILSCRDRGRIYMIDPRNKTQRHPIHLGGRDCMQYDPHRVVRWTDPFSIRFGQNGLLDYRPSDTSLFIMNGEGETFRFPLPDPLFFLS
jgi:hypothetical protein